MSSQGRQGTVYAAATLPSGRRVVLPASDPQRRWEVISAEGAWQLRRRAAAGADGFDYYLDSAARPCDLSENDAAALLRLLDHAAAARSDLRRAKG